jgi:hypothetical protein
VVDVAAQVECQVLLVEEDRGVVLFGPGLLEFGDRVVQAFHVGGVVFGVVDFVDLTGDVRL